MKVMSSRNNWKTQIRKNGGRFISAKQLKQVERLSGGIRKKITSNKTSTVETMVETTKSFEGRRIVELDELAKNLMCCNPKCSNILSLLDTENETRHGAHSVLTVRCRNCKQISIVQTEKIHDVPINLMEVDELGKARRHSDVNEMLVLGSIELGVGCADLNKLLACLNIPEIHPNLYARYLESVGSAIHLVAQASCSKA